MNEIVNAQPMSSAACLADEISTLYAQLLCRHHHRAFHEGGYSIAGKGNAMLFRASNH